MDYADYPINRGIGKPVEFKGLKSQYLFIFAGGLLALFVLFIIMYMVGINQWVCIIFGVTSATLLVMAHIPVKRKVRDTRVNEIVRTQKPPFPYHQPQSHIPIIPFKTSIEMRNILKATTLEKQVSTIHGGKRVHRFQRCRYNSGVPGGTTRTVHRHGCRIRSDTFLLEQGGKGAARL